MAVRAPGWKAWGLAVASMLAMAAWPGQASGHCDGLDGPVVMAARQAIEKGDVTGVLVWVQAADEAEIQDAFNRTLTVRKQGTQARELADMYFFETLVRVHRVAEGAPYTGLKPAGRDLGPAIPAADRALESGDVEPLVELLVSTAQEGVRRHFLEVRDARNHAPGGVAAGRAYVEKYVPFIHYVERLYEAARTAPLGHAPEVGIALPDEH